MTIFLLEPSQVQDKHYKEDYFGYYTAGKTYIFLFNLEFSDTEECISELATCILHEIVHSILDVPELDEFDVYRYYEEVIVQKLCGELDNTAKQIIKELI